MTNPNAADTRILDIDSLLQPIPGPVPAGDERAYAHGLRDQLMELRREERAEDFDDAMRPAELKRADWDGLVQLATESLRSSTKDLRVACHLIEAVAKLHGFVGLEKGLRFLRRLLGECWDRIYPSIDDGDLDARSAPLANMLDDPNRGICFPTSVRMIPLIGAPGNSYGLIQWQRARQSPESKVQEELARAAVETPVCDLDATVEAIAGCEEELRLLVPLLDEKLGADAPAMTNLRDAITQCGQLVHDGFLPACHPNDMFHKLDEPTTTSKAASPANTSMSVMSTTNQAIITRSDAYNQLKRAADTLERLEPHSPIPYLVKRAVRLGGLPFPKLIERLIRDGSVLEELGRELGLAETSDTGSTTTN